MLITHRSNQEKDVEITALYIVGAIIWVTCSISTFQSALDDFIKSPHETQKELIAGTLKFWSTVLFAPYYLLKAAVSKKAK